IKVSWTASTDNVGVKEYRVFVDGNLKIATADLTYTLTGLAAATTYVVYVIGADAAGNASPASASLTVKTLAELVLAIEEPKPDGTINVYPLPFQQSFILDILKSLPFDGTVEIIDMVGNVVAKPDLRYAINGILPVNMASQPCDMYFLILKSASNLIHKKLLKY
ncbi:MAG: hypothetical protein LH606_22765, partial [Cytophagaceae bacterium]|nr:hypothetical protein [Cytophagaceae bacterium]